MKLAFLVFVAGGLGSVARWLVSVLAMRTVGESFPWGTLAVNVVGSLLLGVITRLSLDPKLLSATARLALGTGFMGGFTTYSTFNLETMRYLQEGAIGKGLLYGAATLLGCLAAGALGWALARGLGAP
jgi:CrcB protein